MTQTLIMLLQMMVLCITLPGTLELLVLTVAAIFPKQGLVIDKNQTSIKLPKIAIVMPSHNEAAGIASCIANIQTSLKQTAGCKLVVIADNCDDDTADIAVASGARVLIRQNEKQRGKGYALDYAFTALINEDFDAFLVIDADSRVDEGLVLEFQYAFAQGFDALQCRYRIANPESSRRARLQYIAWLAFNELRLLGREKLNLSVGILGNGFALSRSLVQQVPYEAGSIAEDMEYHLRMVTAGFKIHFLDTVTVHSDAPNQGDNAAVQRSRWEGGRFRLMIDHIPTLFFTVIRGKLQLFEPLAELLLLPLAFHVLLLLVTLLIPLPFLQFYAIAALVLVFAHVLIAIRVAGGGIEDFKTLATVPFYILWKLMLMPKLWRNARNNAKWQRTDRENS